MKTWASILLIVLLISGCATTANRFPSGSNVQVTEWQILHGAGGAKTLRGTVANYSPYLVYDLDLITQFYEGKTLKQELVTRLPSLFPETQTNFEILVPAGLEDPYPVFQYRFQYTHEEEFKQYQYEKKFGIGPFQMVPAARATWYQGPAEEQFDSRQKK